MSTLLNALKQTQNITTTENGAKTFKSTKSAVLDLFALGGAVRNMSDKEVEKLIIDALIEDQVLATKAIFYLGDIRQGQGERRFFKLALQLLLSRLKKGQVFQLISLVPEFARWDYVFDLAGVHEDINTFIKFSVNHAMASDEKNYLLFKWLPTERAHKKTNPQAFVIARILGMSLRDYRLMLTYYRRKLNLVETNLTNKNYSKIDYSQVPSRAGLIYRNAFKKHDGDRYNDFLEQVIAARTGVIEAPAIKMNADRLFPHEIVAKARRTWSVDNMLEAAWLSLPNYAEGDNSNTLVMADTSGSMGCGIDSSSQTTAYDVSVSLALYYAERNKGLFHNHFMTFNSRPKLVEVKGQTLKDKLYNIEEINTSNTDLQAAFDIILNTAISNRMPQNEMPARVLIISDMEFDEADGLSRYNEKQRTNLRAIQDKYSAAGYEMPQIVFWNVNARNKQVPAEMNEKGIILVSGYSPSVFKFITTGEMLTPYELMLKALNSERYSVLDKVFN